MSQEEIIKNINFLLADEFEIDEDSIQSSSKLLDVLSIDSLDLVDLIVLIEKKYGFKVQNEDMATIKTFQDLYEFIINRMDK